MKARLYVDMDGTLTQFSYVPEEKLYEENYFRNLPVNPVALLGLEKFLERYPDLAEVNILSSYLSDRENAVKEKVEWLEDYAPFLEKYNCTFHFIPCGVDKKTAVKNDEAINILLDDHSPNLISFCTEKNNRGIKLINSVNGAGVKWSKSKLDSTTLKPVEFAEELKDIIESFLK